MVLPREPTPPLENSLRKLRQRLSFRPGQPSLPRQIARHQIIKMLRRRHALSALLRTEPTPSCFIRQSAKERTQQIFQLVANVTPGRELVPTDEEVTMRRIGSGRVKPPTTMPTNIRRPRNQNRLDRAIKFHRRLLGFPIVKLRSLLIRRQNPFVFSCVSPSMIRIPRPVRVIGKKINRQAAPRSISSCKFSASLRYAVEQSNRKSFLYTRCGESRTIGLPADATTRSPTPSRSLFLSYLGRQADGPRERGP
jgi:hypothetical protein